MSDMRRLLVTGFGPFPGMPINPTEQLKNLSDSETIAAYTDVLNRLFDLSRGGQDESALHKELTAAFATSNSRVEQPRPTPAKTSSSS